MELGAHEAMTFMVPITAIIDVDSPMGREVFAMPEKVRVAMVGDALHEIVDIVMLAVGRDVSSWFLVKVGVPHSEEDVERMVRQVKGEDGPGL